MRQQEKQGTRELSSVSETEGVGSLSEGAHIHRETLPHKKCVSNYDFEKALEKLNAVCYTEFAKQSES